MSALLNGQPSSAGAVLTSIIEQLPVATVLYRGRELRFERINRAMLDIIGRSKEEVIGKPFLEVMPEVRGQSFIAQMQRVHDTGEAFSATAVPAQMQGFDGQMRTGFFNYSYTPVCDEESGPITGVLVTATEVTQEVTARRAIEEKEEQLRVALEGGDMGTFDFFPQEEKLVWSVKTYELFGLYPESGPVTYQDTFLGGLHPDDRDRTNAIVLEALTPGAAPFEAEYRTVGREDGITRWIRAKGKCSFDTDGQPLRFSGIVQDITARKKAEEESSSANERFLLAEDAANGFIYDWDLKTNKVARSKGFTKVLGFTLSEVEAQPNGWLSLIHPDDAKALGEFSVLDIVETRGSFSEEYRVRTKSGEYKYINDRGVGVRDARGNLARVVGSAVDVTERRVAEEALRESEHRFRSIFNGQFLFLAILSPDGGVLDINELPLQAAGVGRDDVLGKKFWDTTWWRDLPEMRQNWPARLEAAAAADRPILSEDLFQTETGEVRVADAAVTAVRDTDGAVEFFIVQASDITDRKKAEAALRESEERYQTFVRQSSEGIWRFEIGTAVRTDLPVEEQLDLIYEHAYLAECNDAMAQMYGFERAEELHGRHIRDFMPRDAEAEAYLRYFIESGYNVSGAESKEIDRFGNVRYFNNNLVGIIEDGAVQRAWGTQRDITDQRAAQEALRNSEHHLREVTDTVPAIIWITDANGYCNYLNKHWYDLTGQSKEEAEGHGWVDATHPDDKEHTSKLFIEASEQHKPFVALYRLRSKDGTYRWAIDSGAPKFSADGTYEGMIGTVIDVHEQKIAEDALRRSRNELEFAINATELGTWELNPMTLRFTSNNRIKEWFGVPVDLREVPLQLVLDAIDETDRIRASNAALNAFDPASGGRFDVEYTLYHLQTGVPRLVRAKGKVLFTEDGKPYRFNGTLQDITSEATALAALKESEAKFRSVIAAAPAGIGLFVGRDLIIESPNQTFVDIVGKGWGIVGKPLREAMPELITEEQPFLQILDDVFITGVPFVSSASLVKIVQNGVLQNNYYNITYTPLFNEAGKVYAILDIAIDVTAQILAQKELEESELFNRAVVEYSPIAKAVYEGDDFTIKMVNERMLGLMGREADIVGQKYFDVLPELRGTVLEQRLRHVMETGETFHTPEERVDHMRHGKPYTGYYSFTFKPLRNIEGRVYGIMDTAIEVTANVQARKDLEEQKAYLQNALDVGNLGTYRIDLITGASTYTDNIRAWFGLPALDMPLEEMLAAIHPNDQQAVRETISSVKASEGATGHDILYRTTDEQGVTRHLRSIGKATFAGGQAEAITGIIQDATEQVEAQRRIEAGQQQILQSFEQSPVAIALLDGDDFTFRMVNPFYAALVGRQREDLLDKPLLTALPEIARQGFVELLQGVVNTGKPYVNHETPVELERDGKRETIYVDLHYQPRRSHEGPVTGVLVIATDITSGVLARRVVEESEQKLRSLVAGAPFPIGLYVGREMRIHLANRSIIKTWGKGDDVIGKTYAEVLPELADSGIYEQLETVYDTGKPVHAKNQRVDLVVDGDPRPQFFNYSFTPVFDANGQVYGVMNTAANVTDIALARQRAEDAEAQLRGAIELAELATWEVDVATGIGDCSERLRIWIGMKDGEEALSAFMNAVHPDDRRRVAESVQQALELRTAGHYDEEFRLLNRSNGRQRIIHAQGRVTTDATGNATRLAGTAQDITKERALQAELERQVQERTTELAEAARNLTRSNEELSQYAYVASHDLQEPLRKIQMFSGILNGQKELPEAARGTVSRISSAAERMSSLIQSLLEFSRLQKSEDALMRPVNLADVVRDVVQDFELMIAERGATVLIGDLPVVEGVGLQMNQLFYNLVGNALKFSKPDVVPEVRIAARSIPAEVANGRLDGRPTAARYHHITVTDNGIGFEVRYTEQIFEVFKRLHGRDAYPGSGIGLALCKRIVANHGGALYAESEVGRGSTFNILLPQTGV